jgi:hypothetical protein
MLHWESHLEYSAPEPCLWKLLLELGDETAGRASLKEVPAACLSAVQLLSLGRVSLPEIILEFSL